MSTIDSGCPHAYRCAPGSSPRPEAAEYRSEEHTSELQSHSDLHSFPTRRSSDLVLGTRRNAQPSPLAAVADHTEVRVVQDHRERAGEGLRSCQPECPLSIPVVLTRIDALPAHRLVQKRRNTDRKSTRLNSSHTVIYTLSLHDALPILFWAPEEMRNQVRWLP